MGNRPLLRCFTWKEGPGFKPVELFPLVLPLAIERFLCSAVLRRKFEAEFPKMPRCRRKFLLEELPKAYTYDRLVIILG